MSNGQLDELLLRRTFELALQGLGQVSPNPLVGAIIAKNGRIIGEGHHKGPGQPHAEVEALNSCMEDPAGATLYCNLEPCGHTNKRTPPCAPLLAEKGIARVVFSNIDPNPQVSGEGARLLAQAGIEIEHGILAAEGEELNRSFFKFMRTGLPYVHIKLAQTLDGKIATATGHSEWISDQTARREVHKLRYEYDAVMIGRQTALLDDPSLTARGTESEILKVPWRIIIGSPSKLKLGIKLLSDEHSHRTIIFCKAEDMKDSHRDFGPGVTIHSVEEGDFLRAVLKKLASMSIHSVLVEGGAQLAESFIGLGLFDRLTVYTSPIYLGQGPAPFQGRRIDRIAEAMAFGQTKVRVLGSQAVFELSP